MTRLSDVSSKWDDFVTSHVFRRLAIFLVFARRATQQSARLDTPATSSNVPGRIGPVVSTARRTSAHERYRTRTQSVPRLTSFVSPPPLPQPPTNDRYRARRGRRGRPVQDASQALARRRGGRQQLAGHRSRQLPTLRRRRLPFPPRRADHDARRSEKRPRRGSHRRGHGHPARHGLRRPRLAAPGDRPLLLHPPHPHLRPRRILTAARGRARRHGGAPHNRRPLTNPRPARRSSAVPTTRVHARVPRGHHAGGHGTVKAGVHREVPAAPRAERVHVRSRSRHRLVANKRW